MAHADGTVTKAGAKVVKNATGYDVTKLYLGSQGTLGIILEATFRVYPRPAAEQSWCLPVADLETGQVLANRILTSHLIPNRVELLDGSAGRACLSLTYGPSLLVSISGIPRALQAQAGDMVRLAEESGSSPGEIPDPERTWETVGDFPWVTEGPGGAGLRATWRVGVPPADCAKGMRAVQESTKPWAEAAIASSVAHGALRGEFRAETVEALTRSLTASREALTAMGGYLVVLDAPETVRHHVAVWGPPPEGFGVMKRLKAEFDPKGILNPGRFVGGI
jgi:glycolate oxidase FAD binding subunit